MSSHAHGTVKQEAPHFIVVGAGPVGLQAALLLAKAGYRVTVYDKVDDSHVTDGTSKLNSWEDSYPIEAQVTNILLAEAVKQSDCIQILWQHALTAIDFRLKVLKFDNLRTNKQVVVDASASRVLAADGVRSVARREMERAFGPAAGTKNRGGNDDDDDQALRSEFGFVKDKFFLSKVTPWAVRFRVLFSSHDVKNTSEFKLDPSVHYIFSGIYTAIINSGDESGTNRWSIAFFGRRTFGGALVAVNTLRAGEWLCLLGDAAHSAIPPTGEGINGGLEDCKVLHECLKAANGGVPGGSVPNDLFERFDRARLSDVLALHEIASYLNDNFYSNGAEKAARVMAKIFASIRRKLGVGPPLYEELTFGQMSNPPVPYSQVVSVFRNNLLGLCLFRLLVRPFSGVASICRPSALSSDSRTRHRRPVSSCTITRTFLPSAHSPLIIMLWRRPNTSGVQTENGSSMPRRQD
ncbi:Kynurenine 3-monooxygenase [Porphyridium purpureum]|uniref:Kynurenine 3-monooxygenase n=1 Tax=Porphyridium purpureum TaxID=35688 RepID=A0A5J4YUM3_PORPP|nr:Kynurenine 3-monooxygenase [Porphyridium purpureum]|eukprot:POR3473..scf227_4